MTGSGLGGAVMRVSGRRSFRNARGHWEITQYMYQQMPEQSGGGCSGI